VNPRRGYECGQFLNKLESGEEEMASAIRIFILQSQHDIAIGLELEAVLGNGRPCDISAELFQFFALMRGAIDCRVK